MRLHPEIFSEREAETQLAAGFALLETGLVGLVELFVIEIKARRDILVEEARLGEAEVNLQTIDRTADFEAQELPVAHKVAFADRHVANDAFRGRITSAKRQLAGRLFGNFDIEHDAILSRARAPFHFYVFKQT